MIIIIIIITYILQSSIIEVKVKCLLITKT